MVKLDSAKANGRRHEPPAVVPACCMRFSESRLEPGTLHSRSETQETFLEDLHGMAIFEQRIATVHNAPAHVCPECCVTRQAHCQTHVLLRARCNAVLNPHPPVPGRSESPAHQTAWKSHDRCTGDKTVQG